MICLRSISLAALTSSRHCWLSTFGEAAALAIGVTLALASAPSLCVHLPGSCAMQASFRHHPTQPPLNPGAQSSPARRANRDRGVNISLPSSPPFLPPRCFFIEASPCCNGPAIRGNSLTVSAHSCDEPALGATHGGGLPSSLQPPSSSAASPFTCLLWWVVPKSSGSTSGVSTLLGGVAG